MDQQVRVARSKVKELWRIFKAMCPTWTWGGATRFTKSSMELYKRTTRSFSRCNDQQGRMDVALYGDITKRRCGHYLWGISPWCAITSCQVAGGGERSRNPNDAAIVCARKYTLDPNVSPLATDDALGAEAGAARSTCIPRH